MDQIFPHDEQPHNTAKEPIVYHQTPTSKRRSNHISPLSSGGLSSHVYEPRSRNVRPGSKPILAEIDDRYQAGEIHTSVGGNQGKGHSKVNVVRGIATVENSSVGSDLGSRLGTMSNLTDFFSSEVFHIVLHNPTTSHRLSKFCQSRACGENIEFLQRVSLI